MLLSFPVIFFGFVLVAFLVFRVFLLAGFLHSLGIYDVFSVLSQFFVGLFPVILFLFSFVALLLFAHRSLRRRRREHALKLLTLTRNALEHALRSLVKSF